MELIGAKINFLGDSITEGSCTSGGAAVFPEVIKRTRGLARARNYGIGGTRIARQRVPSDEPRIDLDFCARAGDMDPDADAVVVFGGTNDYGHGDAPMGAFGDRTPDTFYGACRELLTTLGAHFPLAKLLVLTPLHRLDDDEPSPDPRKGPALRHPLSDYVRALRETADDMGVPVLDLYDMNLMDPNDPSMKAAYMPDGLHPNDAGHALLAEYISRRLRTL